MEPFLFTVHFYLKEFLSTSVFNEEFFWHSQKRVFLFFFVKNMLISVIQLQQLLSALSYILWWPGVNAPSFTILMKYESDWTKCLVEEKTY